ncbi:MAG: 2-oxoacid:acceptor oxidoreductase family protein [Woeseiaceae bacterium]|nr:2-oxoacid:acceptor oxidoreductase family protein [Woeseiaceae bacterium]
MNSAATNYQVRFGGVGGQGIVLVARLLGIAASLFDGKEAVCTQSYGPEARGGAAKADVVISDDAVDYPFVTEADALAVLFQDAYTKFRPQMRPGGTLIVDADLVRLSDEETNAIVIPAIKIAEGLGSKIVANIVMLGCLVGSTGIVSRESVEEAIRSTVKEHVLDLDLKALDAGIKFAQGEAAA